MTEYHVPAEFSPRIAEERKIGFFTDRPDAEFHARTRPIAEADRRPLEPPSIR